MQFINRNRHKQGDTSVLNLDSSNLVSGATVFFYWWIVKKIIPLLPTPQGKINYHIHHCQSQLLMSTKMQLKPNKEHSHFCTEWSCCIWAKHIRIIMRTAYAMSKKRIALCVVEIKSIVWRELYRNNKNIKEMLLLVACSCMLCLMQRK